MPRIASDLYGRKNVRIARLETRDLASNPTGRSAPYPDNARIMECVDAEGSHRDQFPELSAGLLTTTRNVGQGVLVRSEGEGSLVVW